MADGKITFDTTIDNRQAEKDLKELENQIDAASKKAEKEPDSGMEKTLDAAVDAAGELQKALNSAGRARDEFGSGYNQEAMDFIENYHGASQAVNEMKQALEDAKAVVKDLESQGKWFGDEDYDRAAEKLDRIASDIKQYKKELTSPTQAANPFGLDTYAGKIREAELALQALKNTGKGLGSKEFDEAYRKLALLKDEAKQYAAELSRTPAEAERGAAAAEAAMVAPLERQEAALRKQIDSLTQATRQAREHSAELNQKAQALQIIRDSAQVADERIVALNVELRTLQERLSALESAGVGPGYEEYDRISQRIKEINANIRQYQSGVKGVKKQTTAMASATDQAHASLERMTKRLANTLKSALIFSVLYKGLSMLKTYMGKVMRSNAAFTAQLAQLKGALLTAFQPVMQVIIPALIYFMQILTRITNAIVGLMARITGKSRGQMAKDAKTMYDEAKAIDKVGSSAKAAGKQLASFDEINQLSGNSGSAASGGSSEIAPDFSALDNSLNNTSGRLQDILQLVGAIATGLLTWRIASSLGAGLSQALGLAVAMGSAVAFVTTYLQSWNDGLNLKNVLTLLVSLAGVVGGLGLAFGSTAAGIALVVGGLSLLVLGIHDVIENGLNLENTLTIIAGLLAAGLGISVLTGNWIPLLITGIASALLALVSFTGNGETLISGLKETCMGFADFFKGIFTGDMQLAADGISRIFSGIGTMHQSVIDSMKTACSGFLDWLNEKTNGKFANILTTIQNMLFRRLDGIQQKFNGFLNFLTGVFTLDFQKAMEGIDDFLKGNWNNLLARFEGIINAIIDGLNWVISQMNKISFDIPNWIPLVGGKSFDVNIPYISQFAIPRLAQGAVIPPNREFMAVLGDQKQGTNIEAPLETIKQALAEVMAQYGGRESGDMTVILELDHREFGRAVVKSYNQESKRVGVSLAY